MHAWIFLVENGCAGLCLSPSLVRLKGCVCGGDAEWDAFGKSVVSLYITVVICVGDAKWGVLCKSVVLPSPYGVGLSQRAAWASTDARLDIVEWERK